MKKKLTAKMSLKQFDNGYRLQLPITRYTNDRITKDFIIAQAGLRVPNFKQASGTKYLLNRWREEHIAAGKRITYADLVKQAIALNENKTGPLRTQHGRYNNFTSDYFAARPGATQAKVAQAWNELKKMDVPKTFAAWAKAKRRLKKV